MICKSCEYWKDQAVAWQADCSHRMRTNANLYDKLVTARLIAIILGLVLAAELIYTAFS